MDNLEQFTTNIKYLQFPCMNKETGGFYIRNNTQLKNCNYLPLPIVGLDTYDKMKGNSHHFTTEYHRTYVLPMLNNILNISINVNEFNIIEKYIIDNDHVFDLSYLYPKNDSLFKVKSLEFDNVEYVDTFKGLLYNENVKNLTWFTPYHELYCLPHSSSLIENLNCDNDKCLLILGDSQMIPSIPILCYYYKKIIYIDNRNKKTIINKINNIKIDDILIEMYMAGPSYYKNFLNTYEN